jgi:hypothetical protein
MRVGKSFKRRMAYQLWLFAVTLLVIFLTSRCSFKKNQPEHPYPSESRVNKNFFATTDAKGTVRLKTFIAGWSPQMSAGEWSDEVFVHYNHAEHTNLVFEVEEDKLVGKMIIASFMTKNQDCLDRDSREAKLCRSRWPNIVTIPIQSHFYYERQKDGRGRETDIYIENTQRSHWEARPEMTLDLSGIRINDWAMDLLWPGHSVDSIEDIEWDPKAGFLGFTLEAHNSTMYGGSNVQGKFRYNFLEFKHNPNFKITPYRHANAKYINILHVVGKQIDGDPTNPVLYAAHWDTKKKHTISLYGFPKEYEQIGIDVIEQWNDAFEKIGHGRPLIAKVTDRKYAFDLRHPTITWVDDRRLSASAPLGVGMALADVRNGDIRWGGVTIWGGMLQEYINRSSPNAAAGGLVQSFGARKPIIQLGLMEPKRMVPGTRMAVPESLITSSSFEAIRSDLMNQFTREKEVIDQLMKSSSQNLMQMATMPAQPTESAINPLAQMAETLANPANLTALDVTGALTARQTSVDELMNLKRLDSGRAIVDEMAMGMSALSQRMQMMNNNIGPLEKVYNADFVQGLIKMPKLSESRLDLPVGNPREMHRVHGMTGNELSKQDMIDLIHDHQLGSRTGLASFCTDRHLFDQIDAYTMGMAQHNVDKVEVMRGVIKDLLLHEVGHMLGLGHNFKENILPARGSVPNVSQKAGLYKPFSMDELEKAAHDNDKNYTTVMGYKDGAIDVIMSYDQLMPGPGDVLSLEYLYNARYPIYPVDAKGEGDYQFVGLTQDGWILENVSVGGKLHKPGYFPNCNDFTASRGTDPYCARWDRGYNATTLVQNRFDSYRGNLISQLTAFTDTVKGDAFWMQEYYLWWKSLTNFSRVRVFYDYMRQKYEPEIKAMIASGSESGIQNLLQFSETCRNMSQGKPVENKTLEALFKSKPELLDLCVANGIMVSELSQLMQLPGKDYTQIDYRNRYVSFARGGEARTSFGRAFGTWKELARVPIKLSALMTLTSPFPYSQWGGWAVPINEYSREDGAYHISTLYAKDYTAAVAAGTEMNLNLGNSGLDENTSIGRTIMAMGYYLYNTWFSNDVLTAGAPFVQNIRNQTAFRYSFAIIDVEKEIEEGKQLGRKFTGTIYNYYSRGPEKVPEMYIYTNDRIVLRPPPGSLMMPVTPVRWYSKSGGYFYAIKMDYTDEFFDRLKTNSVRRTLNETYQDVIKKCIQGENRNGLRFFFNKDVPESVFPGFEFPDTIADREDSKNKFLRSVEGQFERYYSNQGANGNPRFTPAPTPAQCEDAIRGQALIVMAASVLNGYYFFDLYDYLEKDMSW